MNMHNIVRGGSIYSGTARFDTGRALTEDELRSVAPSVFATTAHESRSERFKPIPTIEIVRGLAKEGFGVVGAVQRTTKEPGRAPFTGHLLRLRRFDDHPKKYQVGDTVFEIKLKNGNDGTSAYDLLGALWKILCMNSLVAMTDTIDTVKVRHTGDVQSKVIEGTYRVLSEAETYLSAPQDWPAYKLAKEEREAFAKAAHVLRFADGDGNIPNGIATGLEPTRLLECRRQEDTDPNLWNVFNVVQENVIKGGQQAEYTTANMQHRKATTRAIKGMDQDLRLNKALFVLAAEMAKLKAAA